MRNPNAKVGDREKKELIQFLEKAAKSKKLESALADLFTPAEVNEAIARLQIVKLLKKGLPQRQISKDLRVTLSTISRGVQAIRNSKGPFKNEL